MASGFIGGIAFGAGFMLMFVLTVALALGAHKLMKRRAAVVVPTSSTEAPLARAEPEPEPEPEPVELAPSPPAVEAATPETPPSTGPGSDAAPVAIAPAEEPDSLATKMLRQAFVHAREHRKQLLTAEAVALAAVKYGQVRGAFEAGGLPYLTLVAELEAIVRSQPDFDAEASGEAAEPSPSLGFQQVIQQAILANGGSLDGIGGAGLLRQVLALDGEAAPVLMRHGVPFALLEGLAPLPETLTAVPLAELAAAMPPPHAIRQTVDRIVAALVARQPPPWCEPGRSQLLVLGDVQGSEEHDAVLSIARGLPTHHQVRLAASQLSEQGAACRDHVRQFLAASLHPVLLWLSGVPQLLAQPDGHALVQAKAGLATFLQGLAGAPPSLCLVFAMDLDHAEAAPMHKMFVNLTELRWPAPSPRDRRELVEELARRDPQLLPADGPVTAEALVALTEGMGAGEVAELLRRARRAAWMADAAWPSLAALQTTQTEMRRQRAGPAAGSGWEAFTGLKAHVTISTRSDNALDALAGLDDVKRELRRYQRLIVDRPRFVEADCRVPRGLLLQGPPGVGKTAIARAFAKGLGRPFFFQAGPAFTQMYVGVGAARVRSLFRSARAAQPCVVFIDEIDAIGARRSAQSQNTEITSTLNQLLVEMDGFDPSDGVFVMAATNRIDMLDEALTRAGRFDACIAVPLPDAPTRRQILLMRLGANHALAPAEIDRFVDETDGFVGAEIENVVNRARIDALLDGGSGRLDAEPLFLARAEVEAARAARGDAWSDELLSF